MLKSAGKKKNKKTNYLKAYGLREKLIMENSIVKDQCNLNDIKMKIDSNNG